MTALQVVGAILTLLVKSGGADKLAELFNKHHQFVADLMQAKKDLRPPDKAKGYE